MKQYILPEELLEKITKMLLDPLLVNDEEYRELIFMRLKYLKEAPKACQCE